AAPTSRALTGAPPAEGGKARPRPAALPEAPPEHHRPAEKRPPPARLGFSRPGHGRPYGTFIRSSRSGRGPSASRVSRISSPCRLTPAQLTGGACPISSDGSGRVSPSSWGARGKTTGTLNVRHRRHPGVPRLALPGDRGGGRPNARHHGAPRPRWGG